MTRYTQLKVDGSYVNQDGIVTTVPGGSYWLEWTRSDVVRTPEHAERRRNRFTWLPPTAYSSERLLTGYNANGLIRNETSGQVWAGHIAFTSRPINIGEPYDGGQIYANAVLKLRSDIKQNKIEWGPALAESRQTISMIAGTAKAVAKGFLACKHGNLSAACGYFGIKKTRKLKKRWKHPRKHKSTNGLKEAQQLAANRVLELQFGWKPMLADISGAAEFLAERATRRPSAHRFRATGVYAVKYDPDWIFSHDDGSAGGYVEDRQLQKGYVGYRITCWWEVTNRVAVEAARSGLLDLAGTLWEITPFSFIADWVLPIGKTLDSMTATAGKEFIAGSLSLWKRVDAKREQYVKRVGVDKLTYNNVASYRKYRWSNRVVIHDFPPVPYKDLLHVKNPLSVAHAVAALALLAQTARSFFH